MEFLCFERMKKRMGKREFIILNQTKKDAIESGIVG
jgi:hypothetical protein